MYKKLWSEVKKQTECNSVECNSAKSIEYEKDPIKIKFDSYYDLSSNKILWFSHLNIIVESDFQIKDKYYPQIHVHEWECEEWYWHLFLKKKNYKWEISNKLILKIEHIAFLMT